MQTIVDILTAAWSVTTDMAPFLLFGFFVAGLISVMLPAESIERHLGSGGFMPVIKASLLGVPLPLCSCGVIPVAASLRRHGANSGAVLAFLLSTPQTGIDSILVTFSLLGPFYAVFRPAAAFIIGIIGGAAAVAVRDNAVEKTEDISSETTCQSACCRHKDSRSRLRRAVEYGFGTLSADIAPSLVAGILISGVITAFVPDAFFAQRLGTGFMPKLIMMAAGIPIYVCATASIPIAAALIAKGVSPGAAIVFLMTGPATNAATITTIYAMLGKKTTAVYLAVVACSALAAGVMVDTFFSAMIRSGVKTGMGMFPLCIQQVSAVALCVLILYGLYTRSGSHKEKGCH